MRAHVLFWAVCYLRQTLAFVPSPRTQHPIAQYPKFATNRPQRARPLVVDPFEDTASSAREHEAALTSLESSLEAQAYDGTPDIFAPELYTGAPYEVLQAVLAASEQAVIDADESLTSDSVEAIISASQQAVAAAEASLSVDIEKKLCYEHARDSLNSMADADAIVANAETTTRKASSIAAPTVGKILRFAVPAMGVWLCGPLLSLIDTGSVGLLSGTAQQAALNPAVAVTDYSALLIAFLFTGSTNLIAAAQEKDRVLHGCPRTSRTLIGALQLSSYVGTALGLTLLAGAPVLLRAIIGNDAISPAVFDAALKYVRIRALGMPAAAIIGSAQAACLGMQDIRSPLYVLFAAALVNFVGDVLFVGSKHPWIGGAAGAAWATVFSQYAALAMFIHWMTNRPKVLGNRKVVNVSNAILELTGKPRSPGAGRRRRFRESLREFKLSKIASLEEAKAKLRNQGRFSMIAWSLDLFRSKKGPNLKSPSEGSFSVRGFLQDKFQPSDLVKVPPAETIVDFKPYLLPVTTTVLGRVSGYVAMSHVVSSALGTASMAAQQVILSLFYCLTPIADSLSLTAQSFVPGIAEKEPSPDRTVALRTTVRNFVKAAAVFGGLMVSAVSFIPLLSGFFTSDPTVVALVNIVAPYLVGFFAVHGMVCATEGMLLGQKDLTFLGRMYAVFFTLVPLAMLQVKRAALAGCTKTNLASVWKVFVGYQLTRSVVWAFRIAALQRKTEEMSAP